MEQEQRKMTIARGLTRIKTIKAQLQSVANEIRIYGAINNKVRHPLGDTKAELNRNHNQAMEKVESLFQQFHDLTAELTKIKSAINIANQTTPVVIAGKQMTIDEAMIYKRNIEPYVRQLVNSYNNSVVVAQGAVDKYNNGIKVETVDDAVRNLVFADILYLVKPERVSELNEFLVQFVAEIDGTLNEVNAVTEIIITD